MTPAILAALVATAVSLKGPVEQSIDAFTKEKPGEAIELHPLLRLRSGLGEPRERGQRVLDQPREARFEAEPFQLHVQPGKVQPLRVADEHRRERGHDTR